MLAKVFSAAVWGVDAYAVEVEVNATYGKPVTVVVGLPDTAVKESRDRVITAVNNSAFKYPYGRVTFNLAPADVKKEGPSFDLAMALGIVAASDQLTLRNLGDYWVVGELALTGEVRPVKGALAIALSARSTKRRASSFPPPTHPKPPSSRASMSTRSRTCARPPNSSLAPPASFPSASTPTKSSANSTPSRTTSPM
jgi:magnesium chelatase family protein